MTIYVHVAQQLVKHGQLDYLIADYLSEITMSLLAAVKAKRPVSYLAAYIRIVIAPTCV